MAAALRCPRIDDWHLHVRDGAALRSLMAALPPYIARAIIMPNTKPPIVNAEQAAAYRSRIVDALPAGSTFEPLMTLYLTNRTTPADIRAAKASGIVHAVKLYPAGATTNSDAGVTDLWALMDTLECMAEVGLPLLIHGEVTDASVDVFERETVFVASTLTRLVATLPRLKIVLEHITTKAAVDFVVAAPANVAATITAHHMLYNRNGSCPRTHPPIPAGHA
ncbi:dihydroorotase [archaeon]|nr:MAG: dihydroorotase [archaeon]